MIGELAAIAVGLGLSLGLNLGTEAATQPAPAAGIVLDGSVAEWPDGVYMLADEHHVYLRFRTSAPISLISGPVPVGIDLDLDGQAHTGRSVGDLGIDLEIRFSSDTEPGRRPRIGVQAIDLKGNRYALTNGAVGLESAPSHASAWHELRLDRTGKVAEHVPAGSHLSGGEFSGRVLVGGGVPAEPAAAKLTAVMPGEARAHADRELSIPEQADGSVRVMSWNVQWGAPSDSPGPFSRVLRAVKPDVVLIQEAIRDRPDEGEIAAWFETHAGWGGSWVVDSSSAWGVAIASRHPISLRGPDALLTGGTRWNHPIRLAAAVVESPAGPVLLGSVHLKCCGSLATDEDTRRLVEAEAINDALEEMAAESGAPMVVLGGDFNLVGTAGVIPVAAAGLDGDKSPLTLARPVGLTDPALMVTYGRPGTDDLRSRLDYIAYSDATAAVTAAFIVDTHAVSPESLEALGLLVGDTAISDHLPVVIDLKPVD